jgi:hypothetical protein
MTLLATVIDTSALGKVILASLVATVGVTTAFALTILGATRSAEMRRDARPVEATAFGVLSLLGLAVCIAAVALGIVVMTTK